MIRVSHGANQYAKPQFGETPPDLRFQQVLRQLLRTVLGDSMETLSLGDSGQLPLEEFARRFDDVRDLLVARKLRGERLSSEESLVLQTINAALWATMARPKPESEQVRLAVEEAELFLRGLDDGDR